MTLKELYAQIGGDYDRAIGVLRMEKLMDKHIRKLPKGGVIEALLAAGEAMDSTQLFETAHAAKGVCGNLGLMQLSELAAEITEDFRPGAARRLSDRDVAEKLAKISALYEQTTAGIARYEQESVQ